MPKRTIPAAAGLAVALLVATLLTGCRPYTGSTPVAPPGFRCKGKVGVAATASGNDEVRVSLPTSGSYSCVRSSDGYRAVASMRVFTTSSPNGFVVPVPIAGEKRYAYENITKVRFRIQYESACDTAVIDVDAGTATHDPIACG